MKASILAIVCVLALPRLAHAGGGTTCTLTSLSGVAFGPYNVVSAPAVDITGSIVMNCSSGGGGFKIDLPAGGSGSISQRSMARTGGGTAMLYNLYLDTNHTQVWGNGQSGTSDYNGSGTGANQTIYVYGEIKSGQHTLSAGNYTDSLLVTVTF
jgi:spore coat protein U-like protein